MPVTRPWVPTRLEIINDGTTTTVQLLTDLPSTLYLVHQPPYPTRTPLWVTRRGVQVQCGYWISWPQGKCSPQRESPPSTTHTWQVPAVTPPAELWCSATEACPATFGYEQTVPFNIAREVSLVRLPAIGLYYDTPIVLTPFSGWSTRFNALAFSQDWPTPTFPTSLLHCPIDGYLTISFHAQGFAAGTGTIWAQVANGAAHWGSASTAPAATSPAETAVTCTASGLAHAGDTIAVTLENDSTGNYSIPSLQTIRGVLITAAYTSTL